MKESAILYFDGECFMCNQSIKFIINRDKKNIFKIKDNKSLNIKNQDSIVLIHNKIKYKYSSAIIKSITLLGGFYKSAAILYIIPKWIRDKIYKYVANKRYILFNRNDSCSIKQKNRLIK